MAETVGDRIERIAAAKQLQLGAALASMFGVSYESYRKWKTGEAAPNRRRQQVISEVLGVEPSAFMFGEAEAVSGQPLLPDEARLLRAFRVLLIEDKTDLLRQAEKRAREVMEIEARVRAERPAKPSTGKVLRRAA